MKSRRKKIVRKKIRSKLSRKKKHSKAKNKKMKGGAMPLDNYDTLVFDIDGTILPGLCSNGSHLRLHEDTEARLKIVKSITKYKDQIFKLIELLLKIKKKQPDLKLVILTRCWLGYTLKNPYLWYAPELTVRKLFENDGVQFKEDTWNTLLQRIISANKGSPTIYKLHEDKKGILREKAGDRVREFSIIFLLYCMFDELYGMKQLANDCEETWGRWNRCETITKRQHHSSFWSAFVKASYFENLVLEKDKKKVLFFDDEYINTMFVDGLGYDCVSPTKVEKEKGKWAVGWVNEALEYLLNETSDTESSYASQSTYFITSKMDSTEKEKYKTKVIKKMKEETSIDEYTQEVLNGIQNKHFKDKDLESKETLFSDLYEYFIGIPTILFYKCKLPNFCVENDNLAF